MQNRRKAIVWTNADPIHWRHDGELRLAMTTSDTSQPTTRNYNCWHTHVVLIDSDIAIITIINKYDFQVANFYWRSLWWARTWLIVSRSWQPSGDITHMTHWASFDQYFRRCHSEIEEFVIVRLKNIIIYRGAVYLMMMYYITGTCDQSQDYSVEFSDISVFKIPPLCTFVMILHACFNKTVCCTGLACYGQVKKNDNRVYDVELPSSRNFINLHIMIKICKDATVKLKNKTIYKQSVYRMMIPHTWI